MEKQHFTNARIVTRRQVVEGDLTTTDGYIKAICQPLPGPVGKTIDLDGDYLLPGLIEIHTDNLEKNIQPRPGVIWPSILAAALAHDVQIVGAGITTVFDALRWAVCAKAAWMRAFWRSRFTPFAGGGRKSCSKPITPCIFAAKWRTLRWKRTCADTAGIPW